jgi:hypothetical protein
MMASVSTLIDLKGAATPSRTVNFSITPSPTGLPGQRFDGLRPLCLIGSLPKKEPRVKRFGRINARCRGGRGALLPRRRG